MSLLLAAKDMSGNTKLLGAIWGIVFIFSFPLTLAAQITFERTYGGTGDDGGYCVQQTSDGGYIIAGWTESFGAGDKNVYLIRTNAFGDTLWTRTYGGPYTEEGLSIQQTSDGGYVIVGNTSSFGFGWADVYLIKTDTFGKIYWTRIYGGLDVDDGNSIQQTSDGGYIIAGRFGHAGYCQVYLIKTNTNGDTIWTRIYGDYGEGCSLQQTSDGGYIVAGWAYYPTCVGGRCVYLIKTDVNGDTIWTRTYGGMDDDVGSSVQQTSDGGYIIAGWTKSFGAGDKDVYLIKTDADGDTIWMRTYGGINDEEGCSVQQTPDGGYIIAGWTTSFGSGEGDVYLIKTDPNGDVLWTRTYGGTGWDMAYSVAQTSDGGYAIAGVTSSFGAGGYDVYLIRTDANGLTSVEEKHPISVPSNFHLAQNFPNPFNSSTTINYFIPRATDVELSLYDIHGRLIRRLMRGKATAGTYSVRWDGRDSSGREVSSGIYLYRLRAGEAVQTKKMLLLR